IPWLNKSLDMPVQMRDPLGGDVYRRMAQAEPHEASARLDQVGIPGIKYLDQGSRKSNFTDISPEQIKARIGILKDDIASGRGDTARLQDKLSSLETELAFQN